MQVSHVLFGRPWKFDKKTTHEGHNSRYSFYHNGRKNHTCRLSPKKIFEDEKGERENGKKDEK